MSDNTEENKILLDHGNGELPEPHNLINSEEHLIESSAQAYASIDDFNKIEIHVGQVLSGEEVEWSDKLYKLKVDFGPLGERKVLSGIKKFVSLDEIVGRQFPFVTNLAPRKIKDLESQAMILAADSDGVLALFNPSKQIPNGTQLH